MRTGLITIIVVLIILAAAFYFFRSQNSSPDQNNLQEKEMIEDSMSIDSNLAIGSKQNTNKQASFAIFTNGTFRIFTDSMYHNLSEDVFIQSSNPNIIQIKKEGVTWDDFFKTLPFKLDKDCLTTGTGQTFCTGDSGSLKFYINGQLGNDALGKIINPGDKLLVSFGSDTEAQITAQLEEIPNP